MENIIRHRPTPDPEHPERKILRLAFTGYRPQKMPFGFNEQDARCIDFKNRLRNTIESFIWQGYRHFISGGALGMDMFAAEIVQELKEKYPGIVLEMVSPFDGQADKWQVAYRERHDRLFSQADLVTVTGHEYTKSCMFNRNRYMVNNADMLLAAFDGKPGGTEMTIRYARQQGIQVCCIKPVI